MNRTRLFSLLLALALLASLTSETYARSVPPEPAPPTAAAPADATIADAPEVWGTDAYYFAPVIQGSVLFWVATPGACALPGQEFPRPCQIRSRPTNGGIERLLYSSGTVGPSVESNLAADAQFVYWVGSDFSVKRLPRSATTATAATTLGSTASSAANQQFEIAVDASYVFWTESNGGASPAGRLYRMPKAGGPRELMQTYAQPMSQLKADGAGGAYYIAPLFTRILLHTVPATGGFVTDTSSAPVGVASYALDASNVYWAEKISNLRIKRAPRSNLAASVTVEDRGNTGGPTAPTLAVDGTNLYWHETRSNIGPIERRALSGGPSEAITANVTPFWLASSDRFLFWAAGDISRLPVNASAWTLDLTVSALPLEVLQVVQRPANDVPLVSGKETFVRVFPQILSSTPARETLRLWPNVELHGTRGGVALPDSPLLPTPGLGARTISATAPDRRVLDHGLWFRLPSSWTDGTVTLRAVLNGRRVQAETSYANNETSRSVTFTRKSPICLDIKPVSTERGNTVSGWAPWQDEYFRRAQQLLPTNDLRVFFRGGNPLRKPRWYLFESDPFGLSNTNADTGWMLFWLNVNTLFDSNLCSDGGQTIRTVMAQDFPNREVNGMQFGNSLIFFAFPSPSGGFVQNLPGGGVTLAHEIGHSFGRGHVNCGGPAGVDGGFPYPPCQIDNAGPTEHLGFDPQSRTLLTPETTGDLMSYAHLLGTPKPRWPSDYTWRGIFNALGSRSAASTASRAATSAATSAATALIVTGLISGTSAELRESFTLGEPLLSQVTAQLSGLTAPSAAYRLRATNGATVLYDQPLQVAEVSDSGTPFTPFYQRVDLTGPVTKIEIVRVSDGLAIGSVTASADPPAVAITAPTVGSAAGRTLQVAWTATDPDGGLLHHLVRYSADNGTTWTVVASGLTGTALTLDMVGLPGGSSARVQVITTDGLNTAVATSEPFSVARHAPEVSVLPEPSTSYAQGTPVTLRNRAVDAEDGYLTGARVQWQISGPVSASGDGEQLTLLGLPPGTYTARVTGTDSDASSASADAQFSVLPKQVTDSSAPNVDGFCDDAAYSADTDPIALRYADGTAAQLRLVRADGALYACLSGLALSDPADAATLRFDLDNSADALPQAGDLLFSLGRDGAVQSGRGNGTASDTLDALPQGVTGAVSVNDRSWSAELRIDAARLGGWDRLVRLQAAHASAAWPRASSGSAPRSWGLTAFGNQPLRRIWLPLLRR